MKQFVPKILGLSTLFLFVAGFITAGDYGSQKVAYHFNERDLRVTAMGLKNIQNHINAVGKDKLKVIAVFHGWGVLTLSNVSKNKNEQHIAEIIKKRVKKLKSQGVSFKICKNTITGKKIDFKKDLYDVKENDIIPSGVAELAKLQAEGYTYIKP